jgi:hypothetical protein
MQVRKTGMGTLSTRQVCSRETASLLAQAIVKLVGRKRTGRVMLVGCQHIDLLIQLAQHGFVDVTCLAVLAGPNAGEMSADIIIAPAVDREPRLAAVLSRLGRGLRPDGVLFLPVAPDNDTDAADPGALIHKATFVRCTGEPTSSTVLSQDSSIAARAA